MGGGRKLNELNEDGLAKWQQRGSASSRLTVVLMVENSQEFLWRGNTL